MYIDRRVLPEWAVRSNILEFLSVIFTENAEAKQNDLVITEPEKKQPVKENQSQKKGGLLSGFLGNKK